jgi:hypothetical protein
MSALDMAIYGSRKEKFRRELEIVEPEKGWPGSLYD